MWQAEADTEMTLSASPTTAVGQKALALAKRRYSTVVFSLQPQNENDISLLIVQYSIICYSVLRFGAEFSQKISSKTAFKVSKNVLLSS